MLLRRPRTTRATGALVLVLAGSLLAGCREEPDTTRVRAGDVVDASATAYVGAHPVEFMVPSGRITVTVGDPVTTVSALDSGDGSTLVARNGTVLVGLTWTLDRGAYPDSVNYEVASPSAVLGPPQQVKLTLIAGTDRYLVPDVRAMTDTGDRPSNTVWMAIAAADVDNPDVPPDAPASVLSLELDYAGQLQTARAGSGQVDPGSAAAFYEPMPLEHDTSCALRGAPTARCQVRYARGYVYVDRLGWAPEGHEYVVLGLGVDGTPGELTLDGRAEVGTIGDRLATYHVFDVPVQAPALRLAGRVDVGTVGRAVSATLAPVSGQGPT